MKAGFNYSCVGVSLVELMRVIAIIAILLALYFPAIVRVFAEAKNFLFGE